MKVNLIETGGWTNVKTGCSIDTESLPDPVAHTLIEAIENLCDAVGLEEPALARDARTICIEILCNDEWKRASFSEAAPPAEVQPVLEILRPLCRPMPLPSRG